MSEINAQDLHGKWVHSFEEDTAGETVYRPDSFDFPRARGRVSMELKENGAITDSQIGRNDTPAPGTGSWQLDGHRLIISYHNDKAGQTYFIKEAGNEKLVLEKE